MRTYTLVLIFLAALLALPVQARDADSASVHAILIIASKEKAPADPRLAPYEATLQRNLPESSFKFAAEGKARVSGKSARTPIQLGSSGHVLQLSNGNRDGEGIRLRVQWSSGKSVIMDNSFTLQPGVPVVLGNRPSGDGNVPIVIVTAN